MNTCCQGPEGSKIPPMEKSQNALTIGPSLRLQGSLVPFFSFKRPSLGQENQVKVLNKLASARASGAGSSSRVLTDLVEGLEEAAVAVELRLKIDQNHPDLKGGSFRDYGEAVLKHLENSIDLDPKLQKAPVNYEGVRVSGFGGWFLLRLSLHDPVLPLNIEAPTHDDAVKLGLAVLAACKEFSALDTSALDKFVQVS